MSHCLTYPPCSLFNFARKNSLEKERFIPSSFPFSFYQARIEFWHLKKLVFVQACCSSEEKVNTPSQKAFCVSILEAGNRRVKACCGCETRAYSSKLLDAPAFWSKESHTSCVGREEKRWQEVGAFSLSDYIPLRRYPKPLKECTLRPNSRNCLRMLPIALRNGRIEMTRFSSSSLWLSCGESSKRLARIVS